MGLFKGLLIALDLGYSLNFNKKTEIKRKIIENKGTISYIVTRKCHFVVTSDPEKCDVSSKCRLATKHGLPVVKLDYIWDSLEREKLLPFDLYVVGGKSKILDFKSGKISTSLHGEKPKKFRSKTVFNPRTVRIWAVNDSNQPWCYEENYEVAKYAIFSCHTTKSQGMTIVELHTPPAADNVMTHSKMATDKNQTETHNNYRVMLQTGSFKDLDAGKLCHTEVRYVSTADQVLAVFAMLYEDTEKKPATVKWTGPVRAMGSLKFQKLMAQMVDVRGSCDGQVKELVEHVWREAMTEVTSVLGDINAIKIEQVEKAEAILVKVRDSLKSSNSEKLIQDLINEFYTTLPHKNESSDEDGPNRKRWLVKKQDMCQLIRDVLSVSEMTNYETRAYVEAKYAALRCRINHLTGDPRDEIEELIRSSLEGPVQDVTVLNVYEVWRHVEDLDFRHDLDGQRLLFHSSKVENFVGILSRGLLLPKVVVDDFGGQRSDAGMLGSGIYFASSASTSVKYSSPSKIKGSRLLLVNEVALGRVKDYTTHDTTLIAPPDGYNSTHGVSKKLEKTSAFENDEFVVYSVNQQRVRYLVEFTVNGDKTRPIEQSHTYDTNILCHDMEVTNINDVIGITDPLSKIRPGLIGTNNQEVELRDVHIRAKLIDLAAQVVVLQEYCNKSDQAIEAKYVFPLEDTAAICGFEAFINGKHIVGEVKEKETAHKEYKKAISEGHGAYLMDQDEETPDVFTVSVGNLPPRASVLIKITYVAELQVEEEQISFLLPATVAPWKENSALKQSTQDELKSYQMSASATTIQVAVEMPFDIRNLQCPTHNIRVKQTASKAFVEMLSHQEFGSGFQLLVSLAEIHVPRMWVERHPDNTDHQACMLTFYPEFESSEVTDGELILLLDTSNSMRGESLSQAKKVALLVLQNLPSGWHFNLVRFGSDYEELFPAPRSNTEENLQLAICFVQNSMADKGNTSIMLPLRSFFLLPRAEGQRNVFLISDGHINDDELVLRCANQNSLHTRIFSCAVSATCNGYLLKALSRVSGGAFEFFNIKTKSKWEPKVKSQISKACQPGLTSVSVEWQQYDDNLPTPVQAPKEITALFNGSRQVVYGFVPNCTMATLKANVEGQDVSTVVSTSELSITEGMLVHRLTARAVIRDWEDGVLSKDRTKHEVAKMDLKNYIIDLSKEYSIVTQFTSFIAVEKREENEKDLPRKGPSIEELVEKENVDILNYMGWTKSAEHDIQEDDTKQNYILSDFMDDYDDDTMEDGTQDNDIQEQDINFCSMVNSQIQQGADVVNEVVNFDHKKLRKCKLPRHLAKSVANIDETSVGVAESKQLRYDDFEIDEEISKVHAPLRMEPDHVDSDEDMGFGLFDGDAEEANQLHKDIFLQIESEKRMFAEEERKLSADKYIETDYVTMMGTSQSFGLRQNDVSRAKRLLAFEEKYSMSTPVTHDMAPELLQPRYSPTSPSYSPTSPCYSPTSPSYQITEVPQPAELGETLSSRPGLKELKKALNYKTRAYPMLKDGVLNSHAQQYKKQSQPPPSLPAPPPPPQQPQWFESLPPFLGMAADLASEDAGEPLRSLSVAYLRDPLPPQPPQQQFPKRIQTFRRSLFSQSSQAREQSQGLDVVYMDASPSQQPPQQQPPPQQPPPQQPPPQQHQSLSWSFGGASDALSQQAGELLQDLGAVFRQAPPPPPLPPARQPQQGQFERTRHVLRGPSFEGFKRAGREPVALLSAHCAPPQQLMNQFPVTDKASDVQPDYLKETLPLSMPLDCTLAPPQEHQSDLEDITHEHIAQIAQPQVTKALPGSLYHSSDSLKRASDTTPAILGRSSVSPAASAASKISSLERGLLMIPRSPMNCTSFFQSSLNHYCNRRSSPGDPTEKNTRMSAKYKLSPLKNSSNISCIRTRKSPMPPHNLDSLLELQTEVGSWKLNSSLDGLLGISSEECLRILMSSGLGSLGKNAAEEIKQLVATLLVLFSIIELLMPELFPLGELSSIDLLRPGMTFEGAAFKKLVVFEFTEDKIDKIIQSARTGFEFCVRVEQHHPVVYSSLELGTSWVHVTTSFMQPTEA